MTASYVIAVLAVLCLVCVSASTPPPSYCKHTAGRWSSLSLFQVFGRRLQSLAVAAAITSMAPVAILPVSAADIENGARVFSQSCAACHDGGGNIIPFSGDKTLKRDALAKYGYADTASIQQLVLKGKGAMPPYGEFVSPKGMSWRRVAHSQLRIVAFGINTPPNGS
jgi:cytochrome c6